MRRSVPFSAFASSWRVCWGGSQSGNANELGDVGEGPGESCLFFLRVGIPGIGSPGDRDVVPVEHRGSCGVRCALAGP
jgi:hypothetical protein